MRRRCTAESMPCSTYKVLAYCRRSRTLLQCTRSWGIPRLAHPLVQCAGVTTLNEALPFCPSSLACSVRGPGPCGGGAGEGVLPATSTVGCHGTAGFTAAILECFLFERRDERERRFCLLDQPDMAPDCYSGVQLLATAGPFICAGEPAGRPPGCRAPVPCLCQDLLQPGAGSTIFQPPVSLQVWLTVGRMLKVPCLCQDLLQPGAGAQVVGSGSSGAILAPLNPCPVHTSFTRQSNVLVSRLAQHVRCCTLA